MLLNMSVTGEEASHQNNVKPAAISHVHGLVGRKNLNVLIRTVAKIHSAAIAAKIRVAPITRETPKDWKRMTRCTDRRMRKARMLTMSASRMSETEPVCVCVPDRVLFT